MRVEDFLEASENREAISVSGWSRTDIRELVAYAKLIQSLVEGVYGDWGYCSPSGTVMMSEDWRELHDGGYVSCETFEEQDMCTCPRCECAAQDDDMKAVEVPHDGISGSTRTDTESWCATCLCDAAWDCFDCRETYSEDVTSISYNGRSLCDRCYENSYFTCDRCDEVRHNDYYWEDGFCQSCSEDDSASSDGLDEYHRGFRDFRERCQPGKIALGIEIEVDAHDRGNAVEDLRSLKSRTHYELTLEEDGSLDDDSGFEIITPPLGYVEWREYLPKLAEVMRRNELSVFNKEYEYAIHVTVHRRHLTPLQEARMLMFLCSRGNRGFVQAIAERSACYSTDLMGGRSYTTCPIRESLSTNGWASYTTRRGGKGKKLVGYGKYAPINLKPELAEFRIFQSSPEHDTIMKNIEFVYALVEWTDPAVSGMTYHYEDFVLWLGSRLKVTKDYGHLIEFLRRETYEVNGLDEEIENTWAHLLPRKKEPWPKVPGFQLSLDLNQAA